MNAAIVARSHAAFTIQVDPLRLLDARLRGGERSATTESGAASGQRMPFPDYVTAPRTVPILCGDCSSRAWFLSRPVEPHWLIPNDLVGALQGRCQPNGWRLSHDVATRLMFSSRADSFSPANR